jgi:hypothetical protein
MRLPKIALLTAAYLSCVSAALAYNGELVVFVEGLNLRAEPSTGAEVLQVLPYGSGAVRTGAEEYIGDYLWVEVEKGDSTGWAAYRYVVDGEVFDAFKKAIDLARSGDAGGMVEEIERVQAEFDEYSYDGVRGVFPSPDGRTVLLNANDHVLVFKTGRGIIDNLGETWTGGGWCKWSDDSRYIAYCYAPEIVSTVLLYDVSAEEVAFRAAVYGEFEFAGQYLLWVELEEWSPPNPPDVLWEGECYTEVVKAFDPIALMTINVLEPDPATFKEIEEYWYEVQLVPGVDVPAAVIQSEIYKKYDGVYVRWSDYS